MNQKQKSLLTFIAILFFSITLFSSCVKPTSYTCTCTINGIQAETIYDNTTKLTAKDKCNLAETNYKLSDPNASCSLGR